MATRHLYYDITNGNLYTSSGDFVGNSIITVYFSNKEHFTLHYITGTKDAVDGALQPETWDKWTELDGLSIGSTIAFDDDYLHAVRGTLSSAVTSGDTIAIVDVEIASQALNPSDKLTFFNADGSTTTLLYSSYTATETGYAFNLTEASTVDIPVSTVVRVPQALYVKISDVDSTRASEGIFSFTFYAYSHKLLNTIDFSNTASITGTFEHQIISEGNRIKTVAFPFMVTNLLDFDNDATLPSQEGDWVDKAYVQSFFVAGETYQYSADGTNWHDSLQTGDVYYRSRLDTPNSVWSEARHLLYGISISNVEQTKSSTESGEANIVTITLDNGDTTDVYIYNGRKGDKGATGISVANVEQTETSEESSGVNKLTITMSDNTEYTFIVRNGAKGDKGDSFTFDAIGTLAGKDAYNDEAKGFAYLDTENGNIYIKNSDTSADWSEPLPFRGEQGEPGEDGTTPHIGTNGNWYLGETDTGVKAGSNGYTRTVVSSDTTARSGYWYVCTSSVTITLPAGSTGAYIRISTDYNTTGVIVATTNGETIDGDAEGFTLDKTSGTIEVFWNGTGWTVIEAK